MTDKKSPPSGKEEVTDVLSSIRRLVSDELREKSAKRVRATPDVLSLDNDAPLVLSETAKPRLDFRPDPPLTSHPSAPSDATAQPSPVVAAPGPMPASGPDPDLAEVKAPRDPAPGAVAAKAPEDARDGATNEATKKATGRADPSPAFEASLNRVRPLRSEGARLPRPISFTEGFDTEPEPAKEADTAAPGLPLADTPDAIPSDPEPAAGADAEPLPEATLVDRVVSEPVSRPTPRREFAARPAPEDAPRRSTPGLEEKLSPFALASLSKLDGGEREDAEAPSGENSGKINPFAKSRIARETQVGPDTGAADMSAQEGTAGPEDGVPDPEFDSFQSAEAAFAELSQAAEALKSQGAFSGVRSVIEAAGLSYSGSFPKPAEEDAARAAEETPDIPAVAAGGGSAAGTAGPETPAPFFDEGELRQIVTEIVREELAGELGEKLSRNIRKIIRREIALALSDEDGTGILSD